MARCKGCGAVESMAGIPKMTEEEVIKEHIKLVHYVCHRHERRIKDKPWISYEDLQAVGTIGLIIAHRQYNPARGAKFSSFAYRVISNEINKFLRKYKHDLKCISLDQPNPQDDSKKEIKPLDNIVGKEKAAEDRVLIHEIMCILTERERRIIRTAAAGYTQHEIAKVEKISQAHVHRILRKINQKALDFIKEKEGDV